MLLMDILVVIITALFVGSAIWITWVESSANKKD